MVLGKSGSTSRDSQSTRQLVQYKGPMIQYCSGLVVPRLPGPFLVMLKEPCDIGNRTQMWHMLGKHPNFYTILLLFLKINKLFFKIITITIMVSDSLYISK